ncbi:hypothetical protein LG299_06430 [Microbacterium lacus]|uniref:hypothetical protein n=1 Tax=Microbacterium lacus TaxID=415217 RepID=UPI00384C32F7
MTDWRRELTERQLVHLRTFAPLGIHRGQERSARAHTEYRDPDGHQFVYGVGMAHAAQKECQALLREVPGYSEDHVPRSSRMLMRLGHHVIHVQRVGKKMPRNHRRINLRNISDTRRETLTAASNARYADAPPQPLFALDSGDDEQHANLTEALGAAEAKKGLLLVPYYSSTPFTVGQMYLAPAILSGNYLEFSDPEPLVYRQTGTTAQDAAREEPKSNRKFASGARPKTSAKLRE